TLDSSKFPAMVQNGNGFTTYTAADDGSGSPYVLGANSDYLFQITLRSHLSDNDFQFQFTQPVVTSEFGGDLSSDIFSGITATMQYTVLPEPSSVVLGLLGAAGLAVAVIRKRRAGR